MTKTDTMGDEKRPFTLTGIELELQNWAKSAWFQVSSTDHECVDLNQWHVMVFALVMEAHVSAALMNPGGFSLFFKR